MINIDLVNMTVDIKNYSIATQDEYPMLFLGFVIKNQYDDERIQLSEKYNPVKFIHFSSEAVFEEKINIKDPIIVTIVDI